MENVSDALKMGAAALVFIIAFSVTMVMFSRAREATDAIIGGVDPNNYFARIGSLDATVTRVVGVETIIPTIYRYGQSDDNIQIKILATDGTVLQIFDKDIENLVGTDPGANPGADLSKNPNYYYITYLNKLYNDSSKDAYLFGAPWKGQNTKYYLDRINSYIYGKQSKYYKNINYSDKGINNYLMKYKDEKFEERYVEYRTDGEVSIDEYGEEIVKRPATTKTIITYTLVTPPVK